MRLTGRRVDLRAEDWLAGPSGDAGIGESWLQREAERHGGRVLKRDPGAGLPASTALLDGPGFDSAALHPKVRDFYEHTARWRLQLWSQWSPVAWPAGWLISALFARNHAYGCRTHGSAGERQQQEEGNPGWRHRAVDGERRAAGAGCSCRRWPRSFPSQAARTASASPSRASTYLAACAPVSRADVVIDNTLPQSPVLLSTTRQGGVGRW